MLKQSSIQQSEVNIRHRVAGTTPGVYALEVPVQFDRPLAEWPSSKQQEALRGMRDTSIVVFFVLVVPAWPA